MYLILQEMMWNISNRGNISNLHLFRKMLISVCKNAFSSGGSSLMELSKTIKSLRKNYQLWLMIALPLVWLIIFKYFPMYGVLIAFKKYEVSKGVFGSQWVGFQNFIKFM